MTAEPGAVDGCASRGTSWRPRHPGAGRHRRCLPRRRTAVPSHRRHAAGPLSRRHPVPARQGHRPRRALRRRPRRRVPGARRRLHPDAAEGRPACGVLAAVDPRLHPPAHRHRRRPDVHASAGRHGAPRHGLAGPHRHRNARLRAGDAALAGSRLADPVAARTLPRGDLWQRLADARSATTTPRCRIPRARRNRCRARSPSG